MCYIDLFSASEEFWGHYFIPLQKDCMILLADQQKTSCNHISQCNHYLLLSLKRIVANCMVVLIWGSLILGEFDHFSKYSMCFWTKDTCMFASVCLSVWLPTYHHLWIASQFMPSGQEWAPCGLGPHLVLLTFHSKRPLSGKHIVDTLVVTQ